MRHTSRGCVFETVFLYDPAELSRVNYTVVYALTHVNPPARQGRICPFISHSFVEARERILRTATFFLEDGSSCKNRALRSVLLCPTSIRRRRSISDTGVCFVFPNDANGLTHWPSNTSYALRVTNDDKVRDARTERLKVAICEFAGTIEQQFHRS